MPREKSRPAKKSLTTFFMECYQNPEKIEAYRRAQAHEERSLRIRPERRLAIVRASQDVARSLEADRLALLRENERLRDQIAMLRREVDEVHYPPAYYPPMLVVPRENPSLVADFESAYEREQAAVQEQPHGRKIVLNDER